MRSPSSGSPRTRSSRKARWAAEPMTRRLSPWDRAARSGQTQRRSWTRLRRFSLRRASGILSQNKKISREDSMQFMKPAAVCALALASSAGIATAQNTVKVGVILPYSGQFAETGAQVDAGIKLYMKQKGDSVAGQKVEIIRKDVGGIAPDVAKRLAQELVVRDKVDVLAGFVLTPNAIAASDVAEEAKKFMVIMNAATSIITTKSQYSVRTSLTLPMIGETLGTWAATKGGVKKSYTMVSDYGPGLDSEAAFHRAFKAAGGEIVGSVRMAVANPDFSA